MKKVEHDIIKVRAEVYKHLLYALNLFEENNREKKAFALALRNDKFKFLAFEMIKQENHENLNIVNFIDSWISSIPTKQLIEIMS